MLVLIRHLIQFDFGHEKAINLNTERKGFEFANAHLLIKWCFSIRWISCLSVSTVKYLYKGHYWSVLSWLLMKYWNCVLISSRLFWCEVILSKCVSSLQQTLTEHVHLNNDDELHTQTGELGDIVQYLKHQAERGDVESQVFTFYPCFLVIPLCLCDISQVKLELFTLVLLI